MLGKPIWNNLIFQSDFRKHCFRKLALENLERTEQLCRTKIEKLDLGAIGESPWNWVFHIRSITWIHWKRYEANRKRRSKPAAAGCRMTVACGKTCTNFPLRSVTPS